MYYCMYHLLYVMYFCSILVEHNVTEIIEIRKKVLFIKKL